MNERIREIADQARDWAYAEHSGHTAQLLFEQKFAELIIQECADSLRDGCAAVEIKEHFGIE